MIRTFLLLLLLLSNSTATLARGTYQQPDDFINEVFNNAPPKPQAIWLKGNVLKKIESILQHKSRSKRTRYWLQNNKSVWVLQEIGKEKPITVGIVIENNKISQLKVLVFRESRGWEVRYPFFTKQFDQLFLADDNNLSNHIDSISGATLSVRALEKLARIALLLNREITQKAKNNESP